MSISHSEIGKIVGAACIPAATAIAAVAYHDVGVQGVVIILSVGVFLSALAFAYALKADDWMAARNARLEKEWKDYDKAIFLWALSTDPDDDYYRHELVDPFGNERPEVREALDQVLAMKKAGTFPRQPHRPQKPRGKRVLPK